ncbi:MAG: xylanase [Clostridiaceae bacterium]|nr:xylanase [Clostridiaceae bacterium]
MQNSLVEERQSYRNFWALLGKSDAEVAERAAAIWHALKHDPDTGFGREPVAGEMYFFDTGNDDVRTEGQSYGMMLAVQMNDEESFRKIWRWTLRHMYLTDGPCRGYFAWSVPLDGSPRAQGPAPDGEEFFAMALLLAEERWGGSTEGDAESLLGLPYFAYGEWARKILRDVLHRQPGEAPPLWQDNNLIEFVAGSGFTDPSYHLPHFYHRFADYADPVDRERWLAIEQASLRYLPKSLHPKTGMNPEYSDNEGRPVHAPDHHNFFSDAYRTILDIALAGTWPGREAEDWMAEAAQNLAAFFRDIPTDELRRYELDGSDGGRNSRHPVGLLATLATSYMLCQNEDTAVLARRFWDTPLREGRRRYYDNFLYAFSFLALAGLYQGGAKSSS